MPYSISTPATPAGRDFVDYFLNDLHQGYCTYHSTALAVLCRAVGVPSRWVTGYLVPPGSGLRDVNTKEAHAWVEVFIDGHGWQVLEATPSYGVPERIRPKVSPLETTSLDDVILGDAADSVLSPFPERDMEDEGSYGGALPAERPYPEIALGAILLLCAGRVGYCAIDWRKRRTRTRDVTALYASLLRLFGVAGAGPRACETAREYQERLSREWPEAAELTGPMVGLVEESYYGQGRRSRPRADVSLIFSQALRLARVRLGTLRYFFRLYMLNRVVP
jgi:hypothetical protein